MCLGQMRVKEDSKGGKHVKKTMGRKGKKRMGEKGEGK